MSNIFKDMAVLLFSAGDEVEKKAQEFKEKREERYKEFEEKIKDKKEEFQSRYGEEIKKAKENIEEFTSRFGLATKKEVEDIKNSIKEINEKLEKILKK